MKEHIARVKMQYDHHSVDKVASPSQHFADLVGTLCPPTSLIVLPDLSELTDHLLAMVLILLWCRYGLFIRFKAKYLNKCHFTYVVL
jgi:hypothetical protein